MARQFFGHFLVIYLGRWNGAVRIHVTHINSRTATIHGNNVQGGGGRGLVWRNIKKLRKFGKLQNMKLD